jgi:hypothetical protein
MIGWLENWDVSRFVGFRALLDGVDARAESCDAISGLLLNARNSLAVLRETPERHALDAMTAFLAQQTAALGG